MTTQVLWDCFMYGGGPVEEHLLRLRLDTFDEIHDQFTVRHVMTTADVTFSGLPHAPTVPNDLADRIAAIHHVSLADAPSFWHREHAQRDAAFDMLGIGWFIEPDDLVLIGDLDEIPHPGALRAADEIIAADDEAVVKLYGHAHSFAIDMRCEGSPWHLWEYAQPLLAMKATADSFYDGKPSSLRAAQPYTHRSVDLGLPFGWHLSSLGGPKAVWRKLAASAHAADRAVARLTYGDLVDRWMNRRELLDRCALVDVMPDELPPAASDPQGPHASLFSYAIDADLGVAPFTMKEGE